MEVDRAGGKPPVDPPSDYVAYLRGLTKQGAKFTDITQTTVDGRPATLLTGTTRNGLNGSLGCPVAGGDPDLDCFGLQIEFLLRIAVVKVGRTPLVAWARAPIETPDPAFQRTFEEMLQTIHFR